MRRMEKMAEIFLDDLEHDLGILSETMAIWYDLRMFLKGYEKMPFFGRDRIPFVPKINKDSIYIPYARYFFPCLLSVIPFDPSLSAKKIPAMTLEAHGGNSFCLRSSKNYNLIFN